MDRHAAGPAGGSLAGAVPRLTRRTWPLLVVSAAAATPMSAEPPTLAVTAVAADADLGLGGGGWEGVPAHPLTLAAPAHDAGAEPLEPGSFQLALRGGVLALRVDLRDGDVATLAGRDGELLYRAGDLAEWFIGWPPTRSAGGELFPRRYLELHVAPNGVRSAYRIDRPVLPEALAAPPFTAEVRVDGTLNDATDRDGGWSAAVFLPLEALARELPGWEPPPAGGGAGSPLTVLVSRINSSATLPLRPGDGGGGPERTTWPPQPQPVFHLRPHHAPLAWPPPEGGSPAAEDLQVTP